MIKLPVMALFLVVTSTAFAQEATLTKHASEVRTEVRSLPLEGTVRVKRLKLPDLSGSLTLVGDDTFTVHDTVADQDVLVSYEDVKKISSVRKSYARQRRGNGLAVAEVSGAAVIVGLIIYVIVALHSGA